MTTTPSPLRIGNVSASRTDRATATAEFLGAASLDVLALDMLSDEAMLALAAARSGGGPGYEPAALVQLGECLDLIGAGGVRIVTNAGALDPEGLAVELRARASDAGIDLLVAAVDSGDVTDRAVELGLGEADVATVRHGAFGISRALAAGAMLGGGHKLFQAGRTQLGRLDEAQDLLLVNNRQTAIHAVVEGDTPTGQVETGRQRRPGQDVAEEADGVVIGHGTPVGEVDAGVGLGQGEGRTIGRARHSRRLAEALVEACQKGGQDGIRLHRIGGTGAA